MKWKKISILVLFLLLACQKNPTDFSTSEWKAWQVKSPESQGMDTAVMDAAVAHAKTLPFLLGLVVTRHGFIVTEYYLEFFGDQNTPHQTFSVTKSYMSALVGIALHEGFIDSLDQKMMDFFPHVVDDIVQDRVRDVTIRHLLTMKGGFDSELLTEDLIAMDDWVLLTMRHLMHYDPGSKFHYTSYGTHLLSGVITQATGMSTYAFARQYLFDPLGISNLTWETDPSGTYLGGVGLSLTTRDMALFGYLYLNNGFLFNRQIVPESWVTQSFLPDTEFIGSWEDVEDVGYGFSWWLGRVDDQPIYMASGRSGQFIIILPSLEIVISVSCLHKDTGFQSEAVLNLVTRKILPAIK